MENNKCSPVKPVAFLWWRQFAKRVPRRTDIPLKEKEVGKRLRSLRSAWGHTQIDFAERVGIERPSLAKYELGLSPLPWRAGDFLCRTFHLNATWLATGEGPMEPYSPPDTLPKVEQLAGRSFLSVYEEYFASAAKKNPAKEGGSRIGIHVRPSKTNTSYEAFLALLKRLDRQYLEMKHVEDRKAFAGALADVFDAHLAKMIQEKSIPSLHLKETRDK